MTREVSYEVSLYDLFVQPSLQIWRENPSLEVDESTIFYYKGEIHIPPYVSKTETFRCPEKECWGFRETTSEEGLYVGALDYDDRSVRVYDRPTWPRLKSNCCLKTTTSTNNQIFTFHGLYEIFCLVTKSLKLCGHLADPHSDFTSNVRSSRPYPGSTRYRLFESPLWLRPTGVKPVYGPHGSLLTDPH